MAAVLLATSTSGVAQAAPEPERQAPPGGPPAPAVAVPEQERTAVLGADWESSPDRAWVTTGDSVGFHILIADVADGYRWHTLASLAEPGFEADRWIGNACLTGSGRTLVVVYAPRTFTNKTDLFERGGFTATVDMRSGAVTKLPIQTSLAYYNPGCGLGEQALLTQLDGEKGRTRLVRVDTAARALRERIVVPGQLGAAVPTAQGIVAADNGALVRVASDGTRRVLAPAAGVPFKLAADADGGVVYLEQVGRDRAAVRRTSVPVAAKQGVQSARGTVSTLATGGLTEFDVTSGRGGRVQVTGAAQERGTGLGSVSVLAVPKGSRISTHGRLAVSSVGPAARPDPARPEQGVAAEQPLAIAAEAVGSGQPLVFAAEPAEGIQGGQGPNAGMAASPALGVGAAKEGARIAAGDPNDPADFADRYCSVPRNDPRNQAMQPKPRQVEWAVDQAVRNVLTVNRPANWKNLGMPAYTPQGMFPPRTLNGGGYVPAQIMLGIAAQESNLWQAARFAVPGVTANPLIGNYFGVDIYNSTPADDWTIKWSDADCGYGVTQVTDGMRLAGRTKPGETALPYDQQRAVALDFAANVAAGLRILQDKWNQTRGAGLTINNGDVSKIENWFYAVWAYNSGFYPASEAAANNGAWGVGWANNPVNPTYPANRTAFLDVTYQDAAHPQDWPYPEKVMGWAGHPVEVLESPGTLVAGYRAAWWNGDTMTAPINRSRVKPPVTQFCDATNNCEPGKSYLPNDPEVIGAPAGPCAHKSAAGKYDLKCWYNKASTWKTDCSYSCGNELLRFDPGYVYQEDGTAYAPRCTLDGLPSNAQIVDDVPDGTPSVRPGCGRPWTNAGTFRFSYKADSAGQYPGKIDTHQIGGGFGGHFWFTHTRTAADEGGKLEVNATWKLNASRNGPMAVYVALPDHGAHTKFAKYVIKTARGDRTRVVRQPGNGNRWVSLGAFMFNGVPEVTLSSVTPDGNGTQDVAFDAMAFVPITGTFREESIEAVAVFDENQNIDTQPPSSWLGGPLASREKLYNWALDETKTILDLPNCAPGAGGWCHPASVRTYASNWRSEVLAAGTDPVNHPAGKSIARWIGFAQPYTDRPTSSARPAFFDDDNRHKGRTKATVSFVVDSAGKIVAGSEYTEYEHRTGHTHLPKFVTDLFVAIETGYGIRRPDLSYQTKDLNAHNGVSTNVNPLTNGGVLPGRAYAYAGKAAVAVDANGNPSTTNATCVRALFTSGGSVGYRPMLGEDGPAEEMRDYLDRLGAAELIRPLVEDVYHMFFNDGFFAGLSASPFVIAPPIWQELNFRACADGTIRANSNIPILRASWMPDQYLYRNGQSMTITGGNSTSNQPVLRGDFQSFSNAPDPGETVPFWANPFGWCLPLTDRSGNPWNMSGLSLLPPQPAGYNPSSANFCVDHNLVGDPAHSS
ncbi:hypothetical protein C1I93_07930 [Micromonospora endophytica]|uniref:Golvesin/Xly CBD-like domain-containing protein n=1 Tax=Micromonospora endophytica TaxID=515350 RepID=A0A2W2CZF2_9ACTN|nr:hypothetical protein C1I93_07930 [Micromonospora endophytica]RIW43411.1 hypothetical protein D3H59_20775 [Micromonospora endophytica]